MAVRVSKTNIIDDVGTTSRVIGGLIGAISEREPFLARGIARALAQVRGHRVLGS
jgi:hypothetical protein